MEGRCPLFPGVEGAGLRMENPSVPKTLRETLRRPGLTDDGDGGGTSWGEPGRIGSDSKISSWLGGRGRRWCLCRGFPHKEPIQSPNEERSDLVLSRLAAL